MNKKILTILMLLLTSLFYIACDTAEDGEGSSKKNYRIESVQVEGDVAGVTSASYTYDENGLLQKIVQKDDSGEISATISYDYDAAGQLIRETTTDFSGDEVSIIEAEHEYMDGVKIFTQTTNEDQIIVNEIEYYYDTQGRLKQKSIKEASGESIGSVAIEYEEEPTYGEGAVLNEYFLSWQ